MKKYGIIIFLFLFLGYGMFEGKKILSGPSLTITQPQNGQSFTNQNNEISGSVSNASFIRLNDRQIFVDKNGVFREPLTLLSGYNIIRIEVEDKFGKKVQKELKVFLYPEGFEKILKSPSSTPTIASSTEATTTISN